MRKSEIKIIVTCTEKGWEEVLEIKRQIESGELQRGMMNEDFKSVKATFEEIK